MTEETLVPRASLISTSKDAEYVADALLLSDDCSSETDAATVTSLLGYLFAFFDVPERGIRISAMMPITPITAPAAIAALLPDSSFFAMLLWEVSCLYSINTFGCSDSR